MFQKRALPLFAQVQPAIGVTYAELIRKDNQLSEEIKRSPKGKERQAHRY